MYNDLPKIGKNFDEGYFIPLIEQMSKRLAEESSEITADQRYAYADSYKEQILSLLGETPTVYYQALRCAFDKKSEDSIEAFINIDDFPTDLKSCILEKSPEAMLRFLQYIKEEDVPVISPESAVDFYDTERQHEEISHEQPEESERITPEQYASNLGVSVSYISQKIGRQAAECAPIGIAVECMVMNRLGLEEFSMASSPSPEGAEMYNEIMEQISQLPSVCYGLLHSVASNRIMPQFYDTGDISYYDQDTFSLSQADPLKYIREEEKLGTIFENLLSDAAVGRFTITDSSAAAKYYEKYSKLELPKRNTQRSTENIEARIKEGQQDIDKQFKLESEEKKSVKKASDTRFKFYLNQLKKNGAVCKEEYDFLLKRSKIYAKENAMLNKANDKYMKASIKVEKLRLIDDMRDLTPKERKAMAKALDALDKAETKLSAVKDDLIARNRQRAVQNTNSFPEHAQLREEQIISGDTTYIPLHTREDSINLGMYDYRARIYNRDRQELLSPSCVETHDPTRETPDGARTPMVANLGVDSTTRQTRVSERDTQEQERLHQTLRSKEQRALDDPSLE